MVDQAKLRWRIKRDYLELKTCQPTRRSQRHMPNSIATLRVRVASKNSLY